MKLRSLSAAFGLLWLGFSGSTLAAQTHVAVAANFTEPAREIAALFRQKTGHEAVLIFGASGAFFTQITHNAPFEVFLSADEERPRLAVERGFAVPESRFTYAIGKLALWSRVLDVTDGRAALSGGKFLKLAIANPNSAPYGAAAIETMKALGVFEVCKANWFEATAFPRRSSSSTHATQNSVLSPWLSFTASPREPVGSCRKTFIRPFARTPSS